MSEASIEALRWIINVAHGVGRAGGSPEPGEWEAALDAGKTVIARLVEGVGQTMIETCGVCGFKGEPERYIPHDCYWVFRERGIAARKARMSSCEAPNGTPALDAVGQPTNDASAAITRVKDFSDD